MAAEKKLTPHFKWCQDMDRLLLRIEISNVKVDDTKLDITRDAFSFQYKDYELKFSFRFPVNPKTVKYRATRILELVIEKETSNAYWPHLLPKPEKKKFKNHCQIDWDRFLDEDDAKKRQKGVVEDDDAYGNLANMGMGGGDDEESSSDDSDDAPIDDLEIKPDDKKPEEKQTEPIPQPDEEDKDKVSNEEQENKDKTKEEDKDKVAENGGNKQQEQVDETAEDAAAEEVDID